MSLNGLVGRERSLSFIFELIELEGRERRLSLYLSLIELVGRERSLNGYMNYFFSPEALWVYTRVKRLVLAWVSALVSRKGSE